MIKYFTYESQDEYGQHITPINSSQDLTKTASMNYSSEIANVIESMLKKPEMYYVVINALGSYEVWGINGNGDSFPRAGLNHLSLRSDLGTKNDYGYKTFEYYAKLFKHHVNKPDSPSYGEVVFSHWNPDMDRVELIVGIDRVKGSDIVAALENGDNVAVSMGAKLRYDKCSVCGNEARTRAQYCKHAKSYLGKVIDEVTAKAWSKELGKDILPGTKVHAINEYPRFFDISKVHIGADRTAFVLGKAASDNMTIPSVDVADAYGITDELFDSVMAKESALAKESEISKRFGGGFKNEMDGRVAKINKAAVIAKALKEKTTSTIEEEPAISNNSLDYLAGENSIGQILKALLGVGIMPKPREFQRMILSRSGNKNVADELDSRGMIFNHKHCGRSIPFEPSKYGNTDSLSRYLQPLMGDRSFLPGFVEPRMQKITIMVKKASQASTIEDQLEPIAAMYDGFKKYASAITPNSAFSNLLKGIAPLAGFAAYLKLMNIIGESSVASKLADVPASNYEEALVDTNFSGLIDYNREKISSQMTDSLIVPSAYISSSVDQEDVYCNMNSTNGTWMSKQASLDFIMPEVRKDIEKVLFNM